MNFSSAMVQANFIKRTLLIINQIIWKKKLIAENLDDDDLDDYAVNNDFLDDMKDDDIKEDDDDDEKYDSLQIDEDSHDGAMHRDSANFSQVNIMALHFYIITIIKYSFN